MKRVRQQEILDLLSKEKTISTEDLADHFQVSTQTIRRDLDFLETQGLINKMYGGASLKGYSSEPKVKGSVISFPPSENQENKEKIAKFASKFVNDGDTVALDSGTTTRFLGKELFQKNNLVIITRDVLLASIMVGHPTNKVYVLGGFMGDRGDTSGAYAGEFLSTISHINSFFFGVGGVTAEEGFTSIYPGMEVFRTLVLPMAKSKIVLADGSKFGKVCFYKTLNISDANHIVTDKSADNKLVTGIKDMGVDISVVD